MKHYNADTNRNELDKNDLIDLFTVSIHGGNAKEFKSFEEMMECIENCIKNNSLEMNNDSKCDCNKNHKDYQLDDNNEEDIEDEGFTMEDNGIYDDDNDFEDDEILDVIDLLSELLEDVSDDIHDHIDQDVNRIMKAIEYYSKKNSKKTAKKTAKKVEDLINSRFDMLSADIEDKFTELIDYIDKKIMEQSDSIITMIQDNSKKIITECSTSNKKVDKKTNPNK